MANKSQQKRERRRMIPFVQIILIIVIAYGFYTGLKTTNYTYQNAKLPIEFDGFKIIFISDFHCKQFGSHEEKLIQSIKASKPDIVVFTGDMIDKNHKDLTPVKELLSALSGLYPMYAVSGNHEFDNTYLYEELLEYYKEYGVNYLDGKQDIITIGSASVGIYGKRYTGNYYTEEFLQSPDKDQGQFNILLYHDATTFETMNKLGFDLILAGHTHGGIVRLPFIGGLINNNGNMIAKYESGVYEKHKSTLISSRGLGDAMIPRFYNRSELICVTLKKE